jgi:membrane protease YdiL (CAAX protease family)
MLPALFAATWVLGFVTSRSLLLSWLNQFHDFAQYGFDLAYCAVTFFIFTRPAFRLRFSPRRLHGIWIAIMALSGFVIAGVARLTSLPIPWDLTDPTLITLALVVAPILEELLFRGALWKSMLEIEDRIPYFKNRAGVLPAIATSILFSLAHFEIYFHAPAEIHPFILYQTGYTLLMGLALAHILRQERSLFLLMSLHFAFNLGFVLGAIL